VNLSVVQFLVGILTSQKKGKKNVLKCVYWIWLKNWSLFHYWAFTSGFGVSISSCVTRYAIVFFTAYVG